MINEKTKTGLEILQTAVLLGVLGDVLLRQTPWGLNVLLFVGALAAAFAMLVLRRKREFWTPQTIALNAALDFFAPMFVWRDPAELKVLSNDAVPTLLENLDEMSFETQCTVKYNFSYRRQELENENDFRSWNRSRRTAKGLLKANAAEINYSACPGDTLIGPSRHYGLD
jgi:hypothetical protein